MSNLLLRIDGGEYSGRQIWLRPGQVVRVGSSYRCDCQLPHAPRLSPEHFEVGLRRGGGFLKTLDGQSPIMVNGQVIQQGAVQNGDQITAGSLSFSVHVEGVEGAAGPHGMGESNATVPCLDWQEMGNGLSVCDFAEPLSLGSPVLRALGTAGLWLATASADISKELTESVGSSGGQFVDQLVVQPFHQLHDHSPWEDRFESGRAIGLVGPMSAADFAALAPLSALLAAPENLGPYFDAAQAVVARTLLTNMQAILLPDAPQKFRLITETDRTDELRLDAAEPMMETGPPTSDGIVSPEGSDESSSFDPYSEITTDTVMFEGQFSPDDIMEW